jgi:phospholipid/cholesterol/gamma-HCH transport system substrate-binding protein
MDQSKSNNDSGQSGSNPPGGIPPISIPMPKRTLTVEFFVGIFTIITLAAAGYLAVGLGDVRIFNTGEKFITAEFNNVSGLKAGASVELAGVPVGEVNKIVLDKYFAMVELRIHSNFDLKDEDSLAIRTKGIIGDRYVKVIPGGSNTVIPDGGKVRESNTLSVIDFEELIEKVVSNFTNKSDEEK